MDVVWQSEISEICKRMYPAWLRNAEYWRRRLRLREDAYDIMARAIEYVYTHNRPQPADIARYVFSKTKSLALNYYRSDRRTCYLEYDMPLSEIDDGLELNAPEWSRYREQTARLRGDSFIHADLFASRGERSQEVKIYSTSCYIPKTRSIRPLFILSTPSIGGGRATQKQFYDKQKAADALYKL